MNILENLKWFVEDGRNISGLVLSKEDCREILEMMNQRKTQDDESKEKDLYAAAFETYDLIVNWAIENRNDVIEAIEEKHLNIDWAYRLLKGLVDYE